MLSERTLVGGFVVAEAGLQYKPEPGRSRLLGFIAMDVPYLGKLKSSIV